MDITEAVELIRGQQGTTVEPDRVRETGSDNNKQEEKLDVEIVRGEVVLKETRRESSYEPTAMESLDFASIFFLPGSKKLSTSDLLKAIEILKKKHKFKGIILDCAIMQAASFHKLQRNRTFYTKGVVVSVKDNSGAVQHLATSK